MLLSPLDYLRHILDETEYLMVERQGLTREQFLEDKRLQIITDFFSENDIYYGVMNDYKIKNKRI
jgi:hypothetical protein